MNVLCIGDPHGEDSWKHSLDYWVPEEEETLVDQYDYIIFMGDYVDSFTVTNNGIRTNLNEIIELKKKYPKKVILLLGNHDLQYIFYTNDHRCSGYRPEMKWDLYDIFSINKNLFQVAFEIESDDDHKYLFSHAGIHRGYYNIYIKEHFKDNLADTLNYLYPNYKPLYHVSFYRSGNKKEGGVFWADKNETYNKPLRGYHQIIGHTRSEKGIKHYDKYGCDHTSTTYIDCMPEHYELELNILNI